MEIPKPDGGVRKLGIPTVIDRIIQQAMLQQLMPIYEPLFSEDSFGYRPGRGAKDAILRIREYIERGYTRAVVLDLSKYFDTLNHTILLNLLRKQIKDERVIQMVKRYLKSGVMENGVVTETKEGSPQGGNLSPLLANVYLNEFDWEFQRRGVPCIRYADDIVLLAKSERGGGTPAGKQYEISGRDTKAESESEKSRTVSVFAIRNFKFPWLLFWEERKRNLRPCPWKVVGRKPRINCASSLPGAGAEHHPNHGEDKSLHERMAELLRDSGHEEEHRKPEWMVIPSDTDVYLETVETA